MSSVYVSGVIANKASALCQLSFTYSSDMFAAATETL